ncbi:MAG: phage holin family protein [Cyclobacteriaceae bacterium]
MKFIIKLIFAAIAVIIASYLLPGVDVNSFLTAIILAAVLALLNATLKPLLVILTIPITVLTLGLFLLVINALIILFADWLIPGFDVANFWWALAFSLILSILVSIFESLIKSDKE